MTPSTFARWFACCSLHILATCQHDIMRGYVWRPLTCRKRLWSTLHARTERSGSQCIARTPLATSTPSCTAFGAIPSTSGPLCRHGCTCSAIRMSQQYTCPSSVLQLPCLPETGHACTFLRDWKAYCGCTRCNAACCPQALLSMQLTRRTNHICCNCCSVFEPSKCLSLLQVSPGDVLLFGRMPSGKMVLGARPPGPEDVQRSRRAVNGTGAATDKPAKVRQVQAHTAGCSITQTVHEPGI